MHRHTQLADGSEYLPMWPLRLDDLMTLVEELWIE